MKSFLSQFIVLIFLLSTTISAQQNQDSLPRAQVFKSVQALKTASQNLKFNTLAGTMELRDEKINLLPFTVLLHISKKGGQKTVPLSFPLMVVQDLHLIGYTWVSWDPNV